MKKVIEIKDLSVSFTQNNELVKAVQKSNFFINKGNVFLSLVKVVRENQLLLCQ